LAQQALAVAPARDGDEPAPPPWPIVALTCIDRFGAAQPACDAQLAAARAGGEVRSVIILVGFRSAIGLRRGALAEAEADARDAFELAGARGFALDLPATRAFLIELLVEQGRFAEAALAVAEAGQREDVPPHIAWNWFRHARGRARLAAGDAAGALADHLACGEWMREWGGGSPAVMPWRSAAALAHLALGDPAAARALAADEAALARAVGSPRAVGRALRVEGLATGGAEGERLLADAIAALGAAAPGDRAELELAHALVDAGAAARRAGRRRDAREQLATGMDVAHRCAAMPLVQRAREELRAAGGAPPAPRKHGT
jgi:tetratricopeptide (TPR) repeat protein